MAILSPDQIETSIDTYNTKHSSSGNTARDQAYLHSGDVTYERRCDIGNIKNAYFSFSPGESEETNDGIKQSINRNLRNVKDSFLAMRPDPQTSARQEHGQPHPMLPAIAAVPQTGYGTVVTGNGGHVIQYTQRSPIEPEVGPHSHEDSQRLRELDLIKGFLVAIGKCRRYHKDNKHLIAFWDSIERHEQRLRQIEEAFKNTLMCEAIRSHVASDPVEILEIITESVQTAFKLLSARSLKRRPVKTRESPGVSRKRKQKSPHVSRSYSDGNFPPAVKRLPSFKSKAKSEGFPKTSPNRPTKRRFFSDSQASTTRTVQSLVWVSDPIDLEDLDAASLSLDLNVEQLSLLCKRMSALMDIQNAHRAYTMLYQRLSICCREHDRHIIDFELETGSRNNGGSTAGRFRFAIPWNDTHPGEEVWLAFSARPGHSSFSYTGHPNQLECPLRPAFDLDSLTNAEAVLQLSYVPLYEIQRMQAATTVTAPVGRSLGRLKHFLKPSVVRAADIVRLAKQLAIAVLKFNSTPWNSAFWSTNDVILFLESQQSNFSLESLRRPHLRLHLAGAPEKGADVYEARTRSVMFCLGVVLYELWKYFPPLDVCTIYDPKLERLTEVHLEGLKQEYVREIRTQILDRANMWLSEGRVEQDYFDIMSWCLSAPERNAEELEDPQLLNVLYEAVVSGLESVENGYKRNPGDMIEDLFRNF